MRTKQIDIAEAAEVSPSFLSRIFNDERKPSWSMAKRLERVTGIQAADWYELSGESLRAAAIGNFAGQCRFKLSPLWSRNNHLKGRKRGRNEDENDPT